MDNLKIDIHLFESVLRERERESKTQVSFYFFSTCILAVTRSAMWRRSSSCESPINDNALSFTSIMYSRPSLPTNSSIAQMSNPPNNWATWSTQARCLSLTANCSNIAEPVLDFQFPLMLFRLESATITCSLIKYLATLHPLTRRV